MLRDGHWGSPSRILLRSDEAGKLSSGPEVRQARPSEEQVERASTGFRCPDGGGDPVHLAEAPARLKVGEAMNRATGERNTRLGGGVVVTPGNRDTAR